MISRSETSRPNTSSTPSPDDAVTNGQCATPSGCMSTNSPRSSRICRPEEGREIRSWGGGPDRPAVLLFDWWLVKAVAECSGKRLRIGGITERSTGPKVFISAPIIKRLSFCSLETADGITVMMYGVINKQRCRDNGFPSEVYDQFLIGFPYNWEECYNSFLAKQQPCKHGMQNASRVANLSSAGQGPVDGSCEPRSCSVSSFPTSFDMKEVIKFESDRNCSAANSQNEFLTPASTVKNGMEPTTPSNTKQTSPLKNEECDLHTCETSGGFLYLGYMQAVKI